MEFTRRNQMASRGKRPMRQAYSCKECKRSFAMEWAKKNHEPRCIQKEVAMKKHPERYQ